nr:hypothetical protein [Clostridia bacterium]
VYFPESKLPELKPVKRLLYDTSDKTACDSAVTAANELLSLSKFIEDHRTDSFINSMGSSILIGNIEHAYQLHTEDGKFPLCELWEEWKSINSITPKRIVNAAVMYSAYTRKSSFTEDCADLIRTVFGNGFEYTKELPYYPLIGSILLHMLAELPKEELSQLASAVMVWFLRCVPDDMVMIHVPYHQPIPKYLEMAHLLAHNQLIFFCSRLMYTDSKSFRHTFPLAVAAAERCIEAFNKLTKENVIQYNGVQMHLPEIHPRTLCKPEDGAYKTTRLFVGINEYLYAAYLKVITKAQLYEFIFDKDNICDCVDELSHELLRFTDGRYTSQEDNTDESEEGEEYLSFISEIYETVIGIILTSELSRGDNPAEYSHTAGSIRRIYGAKYLSDILNAMGNDTIERSVYCARYKANDRRTSLSHLLSVCVPAEDDTPDTLRKAFEGKKLTQKRLIEAALYSPEWIPLIGRYLGIESFESVCYYFMAHMNEDFDDKRKAIIARYTPLTSDELNLGAFDLNWFGSAYNSVDEKVFSLIYDAAKYTTDGARHTRARKYADAALGKLDASETEQIISQKRN